MKKPENKSGCTGECKSSETMNKPGAFDIGQSKQGEERGQSQERGREERGRGEERGRNEERGREERGRGEERGRSEEQGREERNRGEERGKSEERGRNEERNRGGDMNNGKYRGGKGGQEDNE